MQSPQEWPVQFELQTATLGDRELDVAAANGAHVVGGDLELQRADLREVVHLGLDEIEQTFVIDQLPASGDLVLRMDVRTELVPQVDGDQLRFVHDLSGAVSYGRALVRDAAGNQQNIVRTWSAGRIELVVPGAFVDGAVLPLTIDPPAISQPVGAVAAMPGETWYFQLWHRDNVAGTTTSNLSNGCAVVFTP